jgi:hypothetical protein
MIHNIVENTEYKEIMETQIYEIIEFLLNQDEEFSLTANINGVSFNPSIPTTIAETFPHFTLFTLANYTYSTIELSETHINFETGFGAENFGSVVTIPLSAVFQVIVDDSILFLNPTATVEKYFKKEKKQIIENVDQQTRSMNAFKKNLQNKDLF